MPSCANLWPNLALFVILFRQSRAGLNSSLNFQLVAFCKGKIWLRRLSVVAMMTASQCDYQW